MRISSLIAAFFMWATNNRIIKPITGIKETVERFARGSLSRGCSFKSMSER